MTSFNYCSLDVEASALRLRPSVGINSIDKGKHISKSTIAITKESINVSTTYALTKLYCTKR